MALMLLFLYVGAHGVWQTDIYREDCRTCHMSKISICSCTELYY